MGDEEPTGRDLVRWLLIGAALVCAVAVAYEFFWWAYEFSNGQAGF